MKCSFIKKTCISFRLNSKKICWSNNSAQPNGNPNIS